ncbi:phosphate ABC transporter permease PstA [Cuneatibacter sp. NSJ-177]|uniref:phosphate ABC transporter permease PstA n=1 Tax=Cuneatibacter sp. NSJ-177 TaxID=2931401 RepID=UPI001FD25FE0|nr:phosphate ABC transporter permease PstA [Cuneatibacter sp. NSJ-177]MCJ7836256.1 phosphate ABC transporter permease PstA [Cuneatibacter sp. NSJ-177]
MKKDPLSRLLWFLVWGSAILTAALVAVLIGFVLIRGIPHLRASLFSWTYTSENVSLLPSLINTLAMTALALAAAVPLGVGAAVYLTEYAKRGNRLVGIIRLTSETLAGIPSIVYGLFGMIFFVDTLGLGLSLLSGAATMAVMVLPLMMRTTEEALHSVPDSFREGSFGLGAGRLRTIFRIVLPPAVPGILSGVILSVGRVVGETAALLYTAGTVASLPENLFSSARTLSVHMYTLAGEGLHVDEAYATAVVLLGLVVLINGLSALAAGKWKKGGGHG